MRKLIAGTNMSLDGYCDHTAMTADDEIHDHYNDLLRASDTIIWGRVTYQLMESYWPAVVNEPTGNKPTDDFAVLIDNMSKLVFSRTLKEVTWRSTRLADNSLEAEIRQLKQQSGKDILVGSPSLIVSAANLNLIDELQITVHPVIVGKGLPLFKNISDRIELKLLKTKTFACGAVTHYYAPVEG